MGRFGRRACSGLLLAAALLALSAPGAEAQVKRWIGEDPSVEAPTHVENAKSHKEEPFQKFHLDKVVDIKDKLGDIAWHMSHVDSVLSRLHRSQQTTEVKRTVARIMKDQSSAEKTYMEDESSRRVRDAMAGRPVTSRAFSVVVTEAPVDANHLLAKANAELDAARKSGDAKLVSDAEAGVKRATAVADASKLLPGDAKGALAVAVASGDPSAIREVQKRVRVEAIKAAREQLSSADTEEKVAAAKAALAVAQLPPSPVPAALAAGGDVEEARRQEARIDLAAEACRSGDADRCASAGSSVSNEHKLTAKVDSAGLRGTLEKIKYIIRTREAGDKRSRVKAAVDKIVGAELRKREEQYRAVKAAVQQRRSMIDSLRKREGDAESMKERAKQARSDAESALIISRAELRKEQSVTKELLSENQQLQQLLASMTKQSAEKQKKLKDLME